MTTKTDDKCQTHRNQPKVGCRLCLTDAKVDRDFEAVARLHAEIGAIECDQRFPVKFRPAVLDNPVLAAWLDDWMSDRQAAPWPLLAGPVGRGKTYLAYGLLRRLATSGQPITWQAGTASDFYAELRPRDKHNPEAVMATWRRADVVLLDDLGAAKLTEWAEEQTLRLINHRDENARTTILTTNVEPRQLKDAVGDRIASRLAEACRGAVVVLDGPDRRRTTTEKGK